MLELSLTSRHGGRLFRDGRLRVPRGGHRAAARSGRARALEVVRAILRVGKGGQWDPERRLHRGRRDALRDGRGREGAVRVVRRERPRQVLVWDVRYLRVRTHSLLELIRVWHTLT